MKKVLSILLAALLVLSLAACTQGDNGGSSSDTSNPGDASNTGDTSNPGDTSEDPDASVEDGTGEDNNTVDPSEGDSSTDAPSIDVPGLGQVVIGGVGGVGGGETGGAETEDIAVTEAGDLIDQLNALMDGKTGDMAVDTIGLEFWGSAQFSSYFPGMTYIEGTRVALSLPMIGSQPHVVMLIAPAEGVDAEEYAQELLDHCNPSWQICVTADTVKAEVKDGLILFIMTKGDLIDADALIDAFNA